MAAFNFPDNPTVNEIVTNNATGVSYQWNGSTWVVVSINVANDFQSELNSVKQDVLENRDDISGIETRVVTLENQPSKTIYLIDGSGEPSIELVDKDYVDNAINGVQTLDIQIDQNEEQLQAISTNLLNALSDIQALKNMDITNALSELAKAREDIIELKSKVYALELTQNLNLE